jgi:hypothetical protein
MRVFPSMLFSPSPHTHTHTKKNNSLYSSAVAFVSFYLSLSLSKLLLILSLLRLEAHYGWEKNFGSISTEVASHTHFFFLHISSLPTYSNHSFAVPPPTFLFCFPTVELVTICFLYCQMLDNS